MIVLRNRLAAMGRSVKLICTCFALRVRTDVQSARRAVCTSAAPPHDPHGHSAKTLTAAESTYVRGVRPIRVNCDV